MYALCVSVWGTYYKLSLIIICHSTFTISTVLCVTLFLQIKKNCYEMLSVCTFLYLLYVPLHYVCPAPRTVQCIVSLSGMGCGTCLNTGGLCIVWYGTSSQEIGVL